MCVVSRDRIGSRRVRVPLVGELRVLHRRVVQTVYGLQQVVFIKIRF